MINHRTASGGDQPPKKKKSLRYYAPENGGWEKKRPSFFALLSFREVSKPHHREKQKWTTNLEVASTNQKNMLFCGLFGMLKWPFQRLSDLQLADKKVTLNHLGCSILFMVAVMIKFHTTWNYLFLRCLHNNHFQEMFHKQKNKKKERENKKTCSRWWFQPLLENISQNGSKWIISPKDRGEIVTKCEQTTSETCWSFPPFPSSLAILHFLCCNFFEICSLRTFCLVVFSKMPPETTATKSTPQSGSMKSFMVFVFASWKHKM